jgi:hypothetical protein
MPGGIEESHKKPVMLVNASAEISTGHLSNTSYKRYFSQCAQCVPIVIHAQRKAGYVNSELFPPIFKIPMQIISTNIE